MQLSAILIVPWTFVNIPSKGFFSTIGTCFNAAAWKIISGLFWLKILSILLVFFMSANKALIFIFLALSSISFSILYKRNSELSKRIISLGL